MCGCDSGCDPELFENTLQLRELRLDLEELLAEKKKSADALKKACDAVVKKVSSALCRHQPTGSSPSGPSDRGFFESCRRRW